MRAHRIPGATTSTLDGAPDVIERTYEAAPARVFAAWADLGIKSRWFAGPPEWGTPEHTLDFRVGGVETQRSGPKGGPVFALEAHYLYLDVVPDRRIIYAYAMQLDQTRISVSLATIAFAADGDGTRLILTDQGAYLDGHDSPDQRELSRSPVELGGAHPWSSLQDTSPSSPSSASPTSRAA